MKLISKISFIILVFLIMYLCYQRLSHVKAKLYVTNIKDEYFQGDTMEFKTGIENLSNDSKEFIIQMNILNEWSPEIKAFVDGKSTKFINLSHTISTTSPRGNITIKLYTKKRSFPNITTEKIHFLDIYEKTIKIKKVKKLEKPKIKIKKPPLSPPPLTAKLLLRVPHLVNYDEIIPLQYTITKLSGTSGYVKLNLFCEEDLIYSTTLYLSNETIEGHYNYLLMKDLPKTYIIKSEIINCKTGEVLSSASNYFSLRDLPPVLIHKSVEYIGKNAYRFTIILKDDFGVDNVLLYIRNDKKNLLETKPLHLLEGDKKMGKWQCEIICKKPKEHSYKFCVTDITGQTTETDFTKLPVKK